MYTISVPISVPVSKKKRFYLNLNQYRNAHHFTLSKAKIEFARIVKPLLGSLPPMDQVELVYTLFVGNLQECDTSNICSIVDKFFSDCLVDQKKIVDDNYKFVISAVYRYGGYDKGNPHVKVAINPVGSAGSQGNQDDQTTEREEPMRITLLQPDIEAAIRAYVTAGIGLAEGKEVQMKFSMKRGENGLQGEVSIVDAGTGSPSPAPVIESSSTTENTSEAQTEAPAATTTKTTGKSSSIFGGASKPVNQPQAEPEVASADA